MKHSVRDKFDKLAAEYVQNYERPKSILDYEKLRRMQIAAKYVVDVNPSIVCDAGCGPGSVLSTFHAELPGIRYVGVDFSLSMLKEAAARSLANFSLAQCNVEELPFADNTFDMLIALGVLGYLENNQKFFRSVLRVLNPGGVFIFTYPNKDCINRGLISFCSTAGYATQSQRADTIDSSCIDSMLNKNGFQLVRRFFITYGNGKITFPWSIALSRSLERWCDNRKIGRYLAWSGLCVVRKVAG